MKKLLPRTSFRYLPNPIPHMDMVRVDVPWLGRPIVTSTDGFWQPRIGAGSWPSTAITRAAKHGCHGSSPSRKHRQRTMIISRLPRALARPFCPTPATRESCRRRSSSTGARLPATAWPPNSCCPWRHRSSSSSSTASELCQPSMVHDLCRRPPPCPRSRAAYGCRSRLFHRCLGLSGPWVSIEDHRDHREVSSPLLCLFVRT